MTSKVKAPLVGWFVCAAALILLALVAYGLDAAQHLDATLFVKLVSYQDALGTFANGFVLLGDPLPLVVMLAAACGIALARGRPRAAAAAVAVVAGANLTTQVLKILLAHPRFQPLLGGDQVDPTAFPSGHATAAASIAISFAFVVPRTIRPAVALAGAGLTVAVGCSAVVLSWHYPSDVLGGILVASGWGFAVLASLRTIEGARRPGTAQLGSRSAMPTK